jgi:hypothetical protein
MPPYAENNRIQYHSLSELTTVYFENYLVTCITLVPCENKEYFGTFEDGKFIEKLESKIIKKVWQELPAVFHNVALGNFGVSSNEFTGILKLDHRLSENNSFRFIPKVISRFKERSTKLLNQLHMTHSRVFWKNGYIENPIENLNDLNEALNKINSYK